MYFIALLITVFSLRVCVFGICIYSILCGRSCAALHMEQTTLVGSPVSIVHTILAGIRWLRKKHYILSSKWKLYKNHFQSSGNRYVQFSKDIMLNIMRHCCFQNLRWFMFEVHFAQISFRNCEYSIRDSFSWHYQRIIHLITQFCLQLQCR